MIDLEIAPSDLWFLEQVIGKRREPPNYGTLMVAAMTYIPPTKMGSRTCYWLRSDMVATIIRRLSDWPHETPPNGWMVLPRPDVGGRPMVSFYLVNGEH